MAEREIIDTCERFIKSVSLEYPLLKAFMFGSFAKGTSQPDSDIDLAVVLKKIDNPFQTQLELMKLRRRIDLRIEPHAISKEDFVSSDPLVREIITSGIEISIR